MSLDYSNLVEKLLATIPEILPLYIKELEWNDGETQGAHIIFGDILNPFLIKQLELEDQKELLRRIFNFFEEMALSSDILVQEVLACTVLERLGDEPVILEKAKKYMSFSVQKISGQVELGWGR